jgi:cytidylate kinase
LIDYTLASLTASGSCSGVPLILEGRQPAVIASYCRSRLNKSNLIRLYLTCSLRQQALRFIEREAGLHQAQQADQLLPHHPFSSLNDLVPYIQQFVSPPCPTLDSSLPHSLVLTSCCDVVQSLPEEMRERVCAAFVDNCQRDEDDRRRYAQLYGEAKELDYRDQRLYDAIVDTSLNTPQQTFEQALKAVRALQ